MSTCVDNLHREFPCLCFFKVLNQQQHFCCVDLHVHGIYILSHTIARMPDQVSVCVYFKVVCCAPRYSGIVVYHKLVDYVVVL